MRRLLLTAALLLASAAHAPFASGQIVSVYGTYSQVRSSNVQTGLLTTSAGYQEEYTSYWARGFGGGVTIGLFPLGPLHLGVDLRGSSRPGNNGTDLALGGLKASVKLPILAMKPYVQGSVGYMGTRTTNLTTGANGGTFTNKYLAYEFLGGIDYPIVHFVDFRLIEIGGGQGINVGVSSAVNNASIFTISTGAVFHF